MATESLEGGKRLDPINLTGKLAQVNFAFWIIKICATTLGETGGDALSMTLNLGYAVSTAIFFAFFLITVGGQIASNKYNPILYWLVIISTTLVGTTTSDYITRDGGLGYIWGSVLLFSLVLISLGVWRYFTGSIAIDRITSRKGESFYWVTILVSNTLGTALGDYFADDSGLGYGGSAAVFLGALAILGAMYLWTRTSRPFLFWAAFILTRPLGATLGDFLTKPLSHGGLNLSRFASSLVLFVAIAVLILFFSRRPEVPRESGPIDV